MADIVTISSLLDALPHSDNQSETLAELKTVLNSVHPSALVNVVPNVSFNSVFELLNSDDSEQLQLTCDVLERLLGALEPFALLQQFHTELLVGLGHPSSSVKHLCIKQVQRAGEGSPQQLAGQTEILVQLISLLADDTLDVATHAGNVITLLGKAFKGGANEGLDALFQGNAYDQLVAVMGKSDAVRFRAYELVISIGCLSAEALQQCHASGLLQKLVNEVYRDDVLAQLNSLEILTSLALTEHGLLYLDQQGIVGKLETMMAAAQNDPIAGFLLPGLVKFFGNIAHIHPKEVCDRFSNFINLIFNMVSSDDISLKAISMETIGFIGSTCEGKRALDKQGRHMIQACACMGKTVQIEQSEVKGKALTAICNLLTLKLADQTAELLTLTETWHRAVAPPKPVSVWASLAKQPFPEVRSGALDVLSALAEQPWGQRQMVNEPGLTEYLMDRSTEKSKEFHEAKYKVVRTLAESPTAMDILGAPLMVKVKEFTRQGPIWVQVQSQVAMEGADS